MPEVHPVRILSFSSEDKDYPATNLLKGSSFIKWRCLTGGTKQESVEFSFEEPIKFSRIDVGNNGSAFIEILVRRSAASDSAVSVLLSSSSFLSPIDAKNEVNLSNVRMFNASQFNQSIAEQKWDIVKFVCSQPFNKNLRYGISFVFFHTFKENVLTKTKELPSSIIKLTNHESDDEDNDDSEFKPGSLFKAACNLSQTIEIDNNSASKSIVEKLVNEKMSTHQSCANESAITHHNQMSSTSNSNQNSKSLNSARSNKEKESKERGPLKDVVFVLSGYQNPMRSSLRNKGLSLGARYREDWLPECTHLICAFSNTPKFKVVKGKGIIVSGKWIEQCHLTQSLLDWRPYRVGRAPSPPNLDQDDLTDQSESPNASENSKRSGKHKGLDDNWEFTASDNSEDESEDEDYTDEDDDDDDDVGTFHNKNKRRKCAKNSKFFKKEREKKSLNCGDNNTNDEIESSSSKSADKEEMKANDHDFIIDLPDFFDQKQFFIHNKSIGLDEERLIRRLIVAFSGNLHQYMNDQINYVVTRSDWNSEFDDALKVNPKLIFIKPDWIFDCDQKAQLVDETSYQIYPIA